MMKKMGRPKRKQIASVIRIMEPGQSPRYFSIDKKGSFQEKCPNWMEFPHNMNSSEKVNNFLFEEDKFQNVEELILNEHQDQHNSKSSATNNFWRVEMNCNNLLLSVESPNHSQNQTALNNNILNNDSHVSSPVEHKLGKYQLDLDNFINSVPPIISNFTLSNKLLFLL
ncbi:hypothetical protein TRFO_31549 [Tritrichomonas foetus]|uniref:Uncharacterized protein n=1 Tax=Tritrichomonas foetus TaxID=1144522 RepID=A0A1J4JS42_9EUKA|nr:hypothetical protein TRFO_31549 [Tritrichomonas foetus]|eukprot:OHT01570.1 hypothetical protein TRFO_31549 [Tritrichomonas foetus]